MRTPLFLLVALLVLAFAAARPLHAETHFVTTGADDFQNPPVGSLRHALEVLAQPGDTVKFQTPIVVTQVDKFRIDPDQAGVRVEGPGQIVFKRVGNFKRGVFSVDASGVTLVNLMFKGVHVTVGSFFSEEPTTGFTMEGCKFETQGSLALSRTQGARIENNEFFVARNLDEEPAILLAESDDALVVDNLIENRQLPGLVVSDATNLEARDNISNAPFSILLRSGRVTNNTVTRRSLTVYQDHQEGPIVVEDNTCSMLRVTGVDLSVRRNTVEGKSLLKTNFETPANARVDEDATPLTALGVYVGLLNGQEPYDGPIVVEDNIITGGRVGLQFSQRVATPQTTIAGNEIRGASLQGMSLRITVPATVTDNLVENCTGRGGGPKGGITIFEATEDLLIDGNELLGNRVNGITVFSEVPPTVRGNTIKNGAKPGIAIAKGADAVLENNTIEACKRGGIFLDPAASATLTGNTIKKTAGPGIFVSLEAVLTATGVTVEDNAGPGVLFKKASRGVLSDCTIRKNLGAGVSIVGKAEAQIIGGSFSANRGAGIDIAPPGVSPNSRPKTANGGIDFPDELEFDGAQRKIRGTAEVGAIVQLYRCEPGAREGRRHNGEGFLLVGQTFADGNAKFAISPGAAQEGDLFCLTATRMGAQPVTSEFSENIAVPPGATIERVNVSSNEEESNGALLAGGQPAPNLSDNGRFVVFASRATNHVNDDTNDGLDVFVRDIVDGTTERVSVNSAEEQSTGGAVAPDSYSPSISADGRFIVFGTTATNFVPGSGFSSGFIALRDRETGTTIGVTDPAYFDENRPVQSQHRREGHDPCISADGSTVAFVSVDGAFVPEDTNTWPDIFVWTRATGAYERISVTSAGQQFNGSGDYSTPRLSGDGRFVAFASSQPLVPGNTVAGVKIFLRDRQNQTTELISMNAEGAAVPGHSPSISRDGRYVAFVTGVSLVAEDTNSTDDVYIRDRTNGTIELCSRKPDGAVFLGNAQSPSLSGDGRYVAFGGPGQSDDGGFIVLHGDLFILDRQTGTVLEAGIGISGEALGFSGSPNLSHDGRFLTFVSQGENLVENDTNFLVDLFWRDRAAELEEEE